MAKETLKPVKIRPLHNQVLIRLEKDSQETTKGGIVLPENAKGKQDMLRGEVLAVGPGRVAATFWHEARVTEGPQTVRETLSVKPGDVVMVGRFNGHTIDQDGDELLLVTEDHIFAVVE